MAELKSRILKFMNEDLLTRLNSIALDVLIPDNNTKMNLYIAAFEEFNVPYQELGPGTNRGAFLIDGYVFKIGFDKAGINDNWAEFSLSQQLQPFVTKCYECNGLITVQEYVTVISKEEFNNSKEEVRQILSHLADSYLLGDVGSVTKNFMNWGYREDGSLVILDYAYIYRVIGDELICGGLNADDTFCQYPLEYDMNFHKLICPKCRKQYTFHEIRRRISIEYEEKEKDIIKEIAYKVTQPSQKINKNNSTTIVNNKEEGDNIMGKNNYDCFEENNINEEALYEDAIEFMRKGTPVMEENTDSHDVIIDMEAVDEAAEDMVNASEEIDIDINIESCDDEEISDDDAEVIADFESPIEDVNDEYDETVDSDIEEYVAECITPSEEDKATEAYTEAVNELTTLTNDYHTSYVMDVIVPENGNMTTVDVTEDMDITSMKTVTKIETSSDSTVTIESNDTIILTTPDNVDKMREMLTADLNEKYQDYDDMFNDDSVGFHKIPKKRKDFN